jgi:hypothetical protein
MENFDYFVSLPSVQCESLKNIGDDDNLLLKVYQINGYIKYNILNFYYNYVKDLDSFNTDYCKKYNIDKLNLDIDMWIFNYEIKSTIQLIESKLDTHPVVTAITQQNIVNAINTMVESIDLLKTLEDKIRSVPNYDKLDLLEGRSFKFLRSNHLLDRIKNLLNDYPQSGKYDGLKTAFLASLDDLKET